MDSSTSAILMGFVEGLTEFIPVSSTGHLILVGNLIGFVGEKAASFEVAIQLGAILSIVVLYHESFVALIPRKTVFRDQWKHALQGWSGIVRIGGGNSLYRGCRAAAVKSFMLSRGMRSGAQTGWPARSHH